MALGCDGFNKWTQQYDYIVLLGIVHKMNKITRLNIKLVETNAVLEISNVDVISNLDLKISVLLKSVPHTLSTLVI